MTRLLKDERGSFTVEASLIFPIIFLCIIAVIYICILLYQMVLIQTAADVSAERGAATWSNPEKKISSGMIEKSGINAGGLYWRLFDIHKEKKKSRLGNYLESHIGRYDILKGSYKVSEPDIIDYVVYKKLSLDIEGEYDIPAGTLLKAFGFRDCILLKVHSEAVINEPVEFIRNTDFIMDVEKEAEQKSEGAKKLGDSVRGIMKKMVDALAGFFDK